MLFGLYRFSFEIDSGPDDLKSAKSAVQKIKHKFDVCCRAEVDSSHVLWIVVALLAEDEEAADRQVDLVAKFCEESGIGRIDEEKVLIDYADPDLVGDEAEDD